MFANLLLPPFAGLSFAVAVAIATGRPLDFYGVLACPFGIAAAYFLDNFWDTHRMNSSAHNAILLLCFSACGFILLAAVFYDRRLLGPAALLSFLALFYIPLKHFLLKNLLTALAWVVSVTILPINGYSFSTSFSLTTALFCIVLSNTLLCDVVDVESDRRSYIPSIAVLSSTRLAIAVSLLTAFASVLLALAVGRKGLPFTIVASIYLAISVAGFINRKSIINNKMVLDVPLLLPGLLAMAVYCIQ